jgi:hypothetical protein
VQVPDGSFRRVIKLAYTHLTEPFVYMKVAFRSHLRCFADHDVAGLAIHFRVCKHDVCAAPFIIFHPFFSRRIFRISRDSSRRLRVLRGDRLNSNR